MVAIYGNNSDIRTVMNQIIKGELQTFEFETDVVHHFMSLYPGTCEDDYSIRRYCYDPRIGYHVYIVVLDGSFVSFMIYL